jgi:hypothetical protein
MPNSIVPAAPAGCERDSVHEKDTVFTLSLVVKRKSSKIIRAGNLSVGAAHAAQRNKRMPWTTDRLLRCAARAALTNA